jgi:hypothetical protein
MLVAKYEVHSISGLYDVAEYVEFHFDGSGPGRVLPVLYGFVRL